MGIKKGFKKFLKERSGDSFKNLRLSELGGWKIAVDAVNIFYSHWCVSQNKVFDQMGFGILTQEIDIDLVQERWLNLTWATLKRLLSNGITPVMIFDGTSPIEKKETQEKRISGSDESKIKAEELKSKIKAIPDHLRSKEMLIPLRKLYAQWHTISKINFSNFKIMCKGMGLCVIDAPGEGESLCSGLCRDGHVDAVYSTDTDNLALGCPRWIYEIDKGIVKICYLKGILKDLKFSYPQFVDFCILLGCDYNNGIKDIGVITAYKILSERTSLDNCSGSLKPEDILSLKHTECRKLFSPNTLESVPQINVDKSCLKTYSSDMLTPLKMDYIQELLIDIYETVNFTSKVIDVDIEVKPEVKIEVKVEPMKSIKIDMSGIKL